MSRHVFAKLLVVALPIVWTLGCGVPKEKYNATVKDLENTQMELAKSQQAQLEQERKLQGEIDTLNAKLADLEKNRQDLQAKLDEAKGTLQMYESEHGSLEKRLKATKAEIAELRKARAKTEERLRQFREIANKFASMVRSGKLKVKIRDGKMVIELANNILFDSGSTRIKKDGQAALQELAGVLQQIKKRDFLVAGHTDNVGKPPANWQLSTARAVTVVEFLQDAGVDPTKLAAAGYGQYDPVADNNAKEGRALNRRIEIIMMPNLEELPSIPKDVIQNG